MTNVIAEYLTDPRLPRPPAAPASEPFAARTPRSRVRPFPEDQGHPLAIVGRVMRGTFGLSGQRFIVTDDPGNGSSSSDLASPSGVVHVTQTSPAASAGACGAVGAWLLLPDDIDGLTAGTYRYGSGHHVLEHRPNASAHRWLAHGDTSSGRVTLLLTVDANRTTPRYGALALRLHLLDIGHVLGQLLAVAARERLSPEPHLDLPDRVEHSLGLRDQPEYLVAGASLSLAPSTHGVPAMTWLRGPERAPRTLALPPGYPEAALDAFRVRGTEPQPTIGMPTGRWTTRGRTPVSGFESRFDERAENAVLKAARNVLNPIPKVSVSLVTDARTIAEVIPTSADRDSSKCALIVPELDLAGSEERGGVAVRGAVVAVGVALHAVALAAFAHGGAARTMCAFDAGRIARELTGGAVVAIAAIGHARPEHSTFTLRAGPSSFGPIHSEGKVSRGR